VGRDIHSADRVIPDWQHAKVGDEFRLHPEVRLWRTSGRVRR